MNQPAVNTFVISLGSNVADGRHNISRAISMLRRCLMDVRVSEIYRTPSVTRGDSSVYFNAVAIGHSRLSPAVLASIAKRWERLLGRDRTAKPAVAIDIDIVKCNDSILRPRDFKRRYFLIGYRQLVS